MKKGIVFAAVVLLMFISLPSYSAEKSPIDDLINQRLKSQFFCGYCHVLTYPRVIKKAYLSWKRDKHRNIQCVKCHYPPERQLESIAGHRSIPNDDEGAVKGKSEMEYMKTELEVLSKLTTILNMDESVVRTRPRIDDRSCTTQRCHPTTGIGKEGEFWTKRIKFIEQTRKDKTKRIIPFVHKTHFDKTKWVEGQEMHCTTCHQRETGQTHFEVSKEKCFLCHFKNAKFNEGRSKCSLCHEIPTKPLQKQKKEGEAKPGEKTITHKTIEEAKVPCQSCHLQMIKGKGIVRLEECFNCHDKEKTVIKEASNKKLMHEKHVAGQNASCFNCHEPVEHKQGDFISVVKNDCRACHPGHHKYQEMLLAGKQRKGVAEMPALMFDVKTNCLACHVEKKVVKGEEVESGSGKACAACHTPKHEEMAKEWKDKTADELKNAEEIEKEAVDAIENAKGKISEAKLKKAKAMLKEGRKSMRIVEYGGGVHNKKYSIMLLDNAMNNFEDAIDLIGEEQD
ncbi:MAG TPA: hypothetical protein ENH01_05500 [Nitrospirae bacterium]|nr:class III cytochrome C family protein [bacterium BMS3Bbin08]HDH05156.1 hypothetical protein [Nitrospirota bacterium]